MKVYEGQGMTLHETLKKKRTQEAPQGDFQGIMDQMKLEQDGGSAPVNKGRLEPIPPGGVQILGNVTDTATTQDGTLRNQVLQDLEGTLDLVDFYATRLADRSLSVQEVDLVNVRQVLGPGRRPFHGQQGFERDDAHRQAGSGLANIRARILALEIERLRRAVTSGRRVFRSRWPWRRSPGPRD